MGLDHFKKKSFTKKIEPRKFSDDEIRACKEMSPLAYFQRKFNLGQIKVKDVSSAAGGIRYTQIEVEGILRADNAKDGKWLSVHWSGGSGLGDNISMVIELDNCSFPYAVRTLLNLPAITTEIEMQRHETKKVQEYPRVPPTESGAVAVGRDYLQRRRCLSDEAIRDLEENDLIRYVSNGVIFLGRDYNVDQKTIRCASIRYFEPQAVENTICNKRDLQHSVKLFPLYIKGDGDKVCICEGVINAMSVRDLHRRRGESVPTVIATGGVSVNAFVTKNAFLRDALKAAGRVEIIGENETSDNLPDPLKQARTDAERRKLAVVIAGIGAPVPLIVYPPSGCKDANDWLRADHQLVPDTKGVS